MAKIPAIYGDYSSNILAAGTWTGTAPSTSYALSTLGSFNPAARVRFGSGNVTVTNTCTSALGDIAVIPMHNLDAGSTVLAITTATGLSQTITIPALQSNRYPPTIVIDLKALDSNAAHRTSTTWNFVITANSINVILGGAIAVYGPKTTFLSNMAGDNFAWDYHEKEVHHTRETVNEYGSRYLVDYATATRSIDVVMRANVAGATAIRNWFRANHGGGRPGLFWPDPNIVDALFGTWQSDLDILHKLDTYKPINMTFTELAKGQTLV